MKTLFPTALLGAAATILAAPVAFAASIDVAPIVNEAIADILVPVAVAVVPVVAGLVVMPLRRFLDQKSGDLLASRVNDVLDKSIAFAAKSGQAWVTEKDFHLGVDGWLASVAADYAVSHAPTLMKQAGALASKRAGDYARKAAADLLQQKIVARIADHPDVAALKASVPAPKAA